MTLDERSMAHEGDRAHSQTVVRRISVIAPMRNAQAHVDTFVRDLADQDFAGEIVVLVADGGSANGSVERLRAAARDAGIDLTLLDNPAGWVSPGLNACIRRADGDLIVRLDFHSRYPPDYLRRCAELSERTGAWNVGGRLVPSGETPTERAVACAMDSPFGGIGWSRAAAGGEPVDTDTVTFGAFRPEAFERAGLFDEALIRNQDAELNLRIRQAGGRILLDPAITVLYRPRGTLRGVWRQYFEYGFWRAMVMRKHRKPASLRTVAPLLFVLLTATLLAAAPGSAIARRLLAAKWLAYATAATAFGAHGLRRRREPWPLLPRVIATFPTFHIAFGVGQAWAWLRGLTRTRP